MGTDRGCLAEAVFPARPKAQRQTKATLNKLARTSTRGRSKTVAAEVLCPQHDIETCMHTTLQGRCCVAHDACYTAPAKKAFFNRRNNNPTNPHSSSARSKFTVEYMPWKTWRRMSCRLRFRKLHAAATSTFFHL